ncbi:hypothetical protein [Pararhizobium sp. O133]|uniref:hypothetical protein n=1 Tax=Pararhizobium sp. O133 TaxID=3449278 RepID=UPI003F6895F7
MMAHVTEHGWIEVGQRLQDLWTRVHGWFVVEAVEVHLDEIIRRGGNHLLDDIGVERTRSEDQALTKGVRHRFWML